MLKLILGTALLTGPEINFLPNHRTKPNPKFRSMSLSSIFWVEFMSNITEMVPKAHKDITELFHLK